MSERTKLLKKAVLTSVGASTNVERIKSALDDAMKDLVKVGQDLLSDLETKGKSNADSVQDFLKHLQDEAAKRTSVVEKKVASKVQSEVKKAAQDFGLATHEQMQEVLERLHDLEESVGLTEEQTDGGVEHNEKKRGRRKKA